MAVKNKQVQSSSNIPRKITNLKLLTLNSLFIFLPGKRNNISKKWAVNLPQTTIATGKSCRANFTTVSDDTNKNPARIASIMPSITLLLSMLGLCLLDDVLLFEVSI